jgi:hypothetical protein
MTTKSDQLREAIAECVKRYNEVTSERKALEKEVERLQDERLRLIRESGNSPAQKLLSQRQKYYKKPDPMPMEAIGKVVQQARELSGQIADKVELENSLIAEKDRYVQEHNELMGFSKSLGRRRTIARWGNRS